MRRLILHVGPGKCGSTTIQDAFMDAPPPCSDTVRLHEFLPDEFVDLELGPATQSRLNALDELIRRVIDGVDIAIFSHEFLFQTPQVAGVIAAHLRKFCDDVRVIGYVRPQGALLRSAYSQWLFRAPTRVQEVTVVLTDAGFDPWLFTGLERQFISAVIDDFHSARQLSDYRLLDLWAGYQALERAVAPCPVSVGVLPKSPSDPPLLADFCARAGISFSAGYKEPAPGNPRFNLALVDALNAATVNGITPFDPHSGNEVIGELSASLPPIKIPDPDLMQALIDYTDRYHSADNAQMAAHYDLPRDYFTPACGVDKQALLAHVRAVEAARKDDPRALIDYYGALESAVSAAAPASLFQR